MAYLCGPWPLPANCTNGLDPAQPVDLQAITAATEILWALSGRRFGTCQVVARPCRARCRGGSLFAAAQSAASSHSPLYNGLPMPVACGCPGECGCGPICEIILPGPVVSVDNVTIDQQTLTPGTDYIVYAGGRLTRTTGACWPACQDMGAPLGAPNTWAITYTYGVPVPVAGQMAMITLAAKIKRTCTTGPSDCNTTSPYVESLTSEGQTLNFGDINEIISEGRTGLGTVDAWLEAVNPSNSRSPGLVWSPDLPTYRRQVRP